MFGPGRYSEVETLAGYLEAQLAAIRTAAFGLTDAQARATPCRSALSVGGLVKHATYVCDGRFHRDRPLDETGYASFVGSFQLDEGAPWDCRFEPAPSVHRYHLVHHIEELARHAGHADLLREQLDGASAASLALAAAGTAGNDFVQPWEPS